MNSLYHHLHHCLFSTHHPHPHPHPHRRRLFHSPSIIHVSLNSQGASSYLHSKPSNSLYKLSPSASLCNTSPSESLSRPSPSEALPRLSSSESLSKSSPSDSVPKPSSTDPLSKPSELKTGGVEPNSDGGERNISGIPVPRQRYVPVSKRTLLGGILSMFDSQKEIDEFLRLSSCLDSIIHAEHKGILEEMRLDYSLTHLQEGTRREEIYKERFISQLEDQTFPNGRHLGLDFLGIRRNIFAQNLANEQEIDEFGSLTLSCDRSRVGESRVAVATRFQRTFMKLLRNAEFEELSVRDLQLRSALNTDYLLTLPIFVDWKKASESNAIIFRRGYAAERQRGLLLVEKLDYLQSKFLQELFRNLSKPLKKVGIWINETWCRIGDMEQFQVLFKGIRSWLKTPSRLKELFSENERSSHGDPLGAELQSDSDLPIWLAAQKAVSRYEDFLSSVGPREILFRKLLVWSGFLPALPTVSVVLDCESTISEPHLRPNFLPRVSLSDIWKPATSESCGNDIVKMLKAAISVLFSQSILQEHCPIEFLFGVSVIITIVCYMDKPLLGCDELPSLELKIYERIPLPDLPVIFPHKRLSFRILDTLRLDIASILGLLAYFVNYKFEDILSSPSAFLLDTIAISALIIYVTRVALGYKQTWDRYQLLVNKTLYEKTLASGFGSVHFLVDASEQQQVSAETTSMSLSRKISEIFFLNECSTRKQFWLMCTSSKQIEARDYQEVQSGTHVRDSFMIYLERRWRCLLRKLWRHSLDWGL